MASLNIEQFGDLVELTLSKYIRTDYTALLTDLTDHPAAKSLLTKKRMESRGGTQLEFKVRMGTAGSYEHITPTTPDHVEMTDDFVAATVPWRKVKVGYAFLEEEVDFNAAPEQIVNLVKAKEQGCDVDWIEGLESDWWTFHAVGDTNAFRSLPYWVHKNATTGFNGGIPSGYSDVAGLSPTTWPRWNNYTAQYTAVTLDDLVSKVRTMAVKTNFKPMVPGIPDLGKAGSRSYYVNHDTMKVLEDLLDARNDNMGKDIAKHDGQVMFRGAPVTYVPKLDEDTTNPWYQIDWDSFKMLTKSSWWQKRTILKPYPGQRNQVAVFKDTYLNFACFNRRNQGVVATGTTYPS